MTLQEVFYVWREAKKPFVKDSTLSAYDLSFAVRISPYMGHIDVCDINKKKVVELMILLRGKGLSIKTCMDVKIVLKMIIDYAASDLDLDVKNTHWSMEWPQEMRETKEKGICRYSDGEVRRIVDYAISHPSPQTMAVILTLSTGMRIGEVCALRWKDVDFNEKVIHVRNNIERVYDVYNHKTSIVFHEGKTETARRKIPITGEVLKMMKDFSRVCTPDYFVATCRENFTEPRTFRNFYRSFILDKVGLDRCIKFHGLRHTFASKLVESNVPVKIVSELLGHSDVSTTLNTYSHPSDEMKRKAVQNKLAPLFRKKKDA